MEVIYVGVAKRAATASSLVDLGSLGLLFCLLVSDALVVGARNVDLHSRGLLLQVIEIILGLCKLGLRIL